MKKLILLATIVVMFSGCDDVQGNIDKYLKARNKAINVAKVLGCEKKCFNTCDISNDILRVECKAKCVVKCNND